MGTRDHHRRWRDPRTTPGTITASAPPYRRLGNGTIALTGTTPATPPGRAGGPTGGGWGGWGFGGPGALGGCGGGGGVGWRCGRGGVGGGGRGKACTSGGAARGGDTWARTPRPHDGALVHAGWSSGAF